MKKPTLYFFSTKSYEQKAFESSSLIKKFRPHFLPHRLDKISALSVKDHSLICAFASDNLGEETLNILHEKKVRFILLRSAGFNHVDLETAKKLDLKIARVPAYSPESIAEHTVGLMLSLSRKIHKAYNRVREGNFSLEGLTGFCFHGKTVGIIGAGKIGVATAKILKGMGCHILIYDIEEREEFKRLGFIFVDKNEVFTKSDIISLHCPLTPQTHQIIDEQALRKMKDGIMLINTGRGGLVDTKALVGALKNKKIGSLGLDVYEEEESLFFQDLSGDIIHDDLFARLLTFPNVLITGHQAFLTWEALENIAQTTLQNGLSFLEQKECLNQVKI